MAQRDFSGQGNTKPRRNVHPTPLRRVIHHGPAQNTASFATDIAPGIVALSSLMDEVYHAIQQLVNNKVSNDGIPVEKTCLDSLEQ